MVSIRRHLAPLTRTSGRGNTRRLITIHETANRSRGAGASVHARLQAGTNPRQASWHYQVDDKSVIQSFDDDVKCWHAGGTANSQSIAIEICVNSDSNYNKALDNAAALVAHLRKKHGIPWNRVVSHNYWTGKNCPTIMLSRKGQWDKFIAASNPSGGSSVPTGGSSSSSTSSTSTQGIVYTNRRNAPIYKGTGSNAKKDPQHPTAQNYKLAKLGTKGKSGSWTKISWKGRTRWIKTAHVSTKKTPVIVATNKDKVEFFANRGSNKKSLGLAHNKGYRVALIETAGSWSRVRWKGQNAWVPTAHIDYA